MEIPGLRADAAAYAHSLQQRFPAGATSRQRADSEARALSAEARKDWAGAAVALSDRLGQGETTPALWLSLARDLLNQTKSDPAHALAAAWQAFEASSEGADQVPALLVMHDALAALNRPVPEIETLEAASERAPDNSGLRRQLALREQQLGLLVRRVRTEPESFPARACVAFIGRPGGAADFHAADWVRLDPKVPDAAVTLESGEVCITGLRPGTPTRVSLVAGMPGADGVSLKAPETLAVAMPDRQPRLVFDGARFLQPSSAPPQVSLASVNLSAVKLDLVRVTERAAQPFLAAHPPGDELADTDLDGLRQSGELVWSGRAEIPGFARNALLHTRLPLPGAALDRPGLYLLLARTGDGTPRSDGEGPQAVQMVLRTDLAPTAWQGGDGLSVQVRGYADAQPKPGVQVALIAADNDVLATEVTGPDGIARFAPALLHGEAGTAPAALHLASADGNDFTVLSLTRPAFDLADRGVAGRPQPGPLDAFVWLDRGIYRPGETVQATALLRDAAGHPAAVPVHVIVKRPGGQVFADIVPKPGEGGSLSVPIALSGGAQAGEWSIALQTTKDGPEVGHASFQVEAFVPARLAVELTKPAAPLPPGQTSQIPVAVRFLYGAPGAGLSGDANVRLEANPTPFTDLAEYRFGLEGEQVPDSPATPDLPETDAQGNTTLPLDLTHLPDVTGALQARVTATVNDPAGRPVAATATVPIRPASPLIGIRTTIPDGTAVEPGKEAGFDVIAVDPQGNRVAMPVRMTLVRQVPDWRLVVNRGVASYETAWRDEPVDSGAATIPASGPPLHFAWQLGFGRYKLQVVQAGKGLAAGSRVFTAGWEDSGNPDVPARLRVSTGQASYKPGDTARVHIEAPFAGPATLLVLTDRVHLVRDLDLPAAGLDVDVPVGADWGPGAYVAVHAYRPARDGAVSERAIGVTWLAMDRGVRTLPVAVETPPVLRPRGKATVAVRTAPGAWLTLAAVDEGVLRLTNFATPDPLEHFMGRRALGVDIRDEWGRLLRPAEGMLTSLHQGGGGGDDFGAAPPPPQRVVALFTPPVQAGPDGIAHVDLDLPDFNGQLRLMAVAWSGDQVGNAGLDVFVRDPLVAEALLPRFLAPGDTARLGVLLQNVELPPGPVQVRITAGGALALAGPDTVQASLGAGEKSVQSTTLRAGEAGEGRIALDVTGPGGFSARHEVSLFVHPARGRIVAVAGASLAPGAEATVAPDTGAFVPGTWTASLSLGGAVRYGVAGLVQALADYPLSCLEQVTSRGLPLAMLPDGAAAGPDRAGRLETQVELALDRQRYDGAFGLWSSEDDAQPWLTAYATEFLLRAKRAGAAVPPTALDGALGWLADEITHSPDDPEARAAQAYAVYVLALAGRAPAGAIRVMASSEDDLPTPLARAQLAAALARVSEPQPAAALFRASFTAPDRKFWYKDYGSALRDQFATAVLIKESGTDAVAAPALASGLPGANLDPKTLDTQEQAWAAAAAAALGEGAPPVSARVGGRELKGAPLVTLPLTDPVQVRNTGAAPLWESVSVSGVPRVAPPASRALMQVRRHFFDQRGQAVDPDKLPQNTTFVLLIEGKADDGQDHQAMLRAGLPAGWEIADDSPRARCRAWTGWAS